MTGQICTVSGRDILWHSRDESGTTSLNSHMFGSFYIMCAKSEPGHVIGSKHVTRAVACAEQSGAKSYS